MSSRVRVKLNFPALVAHLAREDRRKITNEDAVKWLQDAGFSQSGEYWTVDQRDLGHVDPSEVLEVEPISERD